MSEAKDVLAGEVIIAAKLEENGVAVRTKSRAVAALDRLVGSLFDMPAAIFEGVARKRRLKDTIEERLKLTQAAIAESRLQDHPEVADLLIYDVLQDRARKLTNMAGVAVEAVDALKALPPPPDASSSEGVQQDEPIDPDWMNQFQRYAEDASSEDLQQLWGRVLAGEIQKAGSFSRHTLRFIAELDKETALNCEFAAKRLVGNFIPNEDEWMGGDGLMKAIDLQRLGLIEGVGAFGTQHQSTVQPSGAVAVFARKYALRIDGKPNTTVSFQVMLLTRLGIEVMSLLDSSGERDSLRKLADKFKVAGITKISLGTWITVDRDNVRFFEEEVLYTAPAASE